jgi:lipid-binding SYLF domain-containing protein
VRHFFTFAPVRRCRAPGSFASCSATASGIGWLILSLAIFLGPGALAGPREEIEFKVEAALETFAKESPEGKALMDRAAGVLVFPDVYQLGFGIGGEYGEGALLIGGKPVAYYSTSGASFGLQVGAQTKSQVLLFMTRKALAKFRRSRGWEAGVDGSVAMVTEGVGDDVASRTADQPVIGFVFSNKGLMYDLTLEGSKIAPLEF